MAEHYLGYGAAMSISVSNMVWAHRGLDATRKLVLLRLADSAQDDGTSIFPSVPRIAADCAIDERTVQRTIARLRESGLVTLVAEADASKRRAREYRMDLENLKAGIPPPAQRHPRQSATPGTTPPLADCHPWQNATSPPAPCHPTPGTVPPLTINNHPETKYAFVGKIVRLTADDFDRWKAAYSSIVDMQAELSVIDDWLCGQSDAKRKKWFHTASAWLNRKHQALVSAAPRNPRRRQISDQPEFQMVNK